MKFYCTEDVMINISSCLLAASCLIQFVIYSLLCRLTRVMEYCRHLVVKCKYSRCYGLYRSGFQSI